jgi:hypothetical protein
MTTVLNRLLCLQGAFARKVSETVVVTITRRPRLHRCGRREWTTCAAYDHRASSWRHVALGSWR